MTDSDAQQPTRAKYVVVCKTCGPVGDKYRSVKPDSARNLENDPAYRHYDRTGHTVLSVRETDAPPEIRAMLKADDVADINFKKLAEYAAGTGEYA